MENSTFEKIRRLVGPLKKSDLKYVDSFAADEIGIFLPVAGSCGYAVTPSHTHPGYMFIHTYDDRSEVKIGGKIVKSIPGCVQAVSPEIPHQEIPSDVPPRYAAIMIEKNFFMKNFSDYGKIIPVFKGEYYPAPTSLSHLVRSFVAEHGSNLPGGETVLKSIGVEICHCIIRCVLSIGNDSEARTISSEINGSIEYIKNNIGGRITVRALSGAANLSASHFTRIFREETGMTPMDYVRKTRLEHAKKMLRAGDKSITEIALECGFNSSAYLSSIFSGENGLTPSEYQRLYNK